MTFLNRFKMEMKKLIPGDPMDPKTTLGPLCTNKEHLILYRSRLRMRLTAAQRYCWVENDLIGRDTSWNQRF